MGTVTIKQTAKRWHKRAFVTSVVPPRHHARSRERFEMFMIIRNHAVRRRPAVTFYARSNSRPFRSLEFLTSGTSDEISAASLVRFLAIFRRLLTVHIPVRILTSNSYHRTLRKKPAQSEVMMLERSFPVTTTAVTHDFPV